MWYAMIGGLTVPTYIRRRPGTLLDALRFKGNCTPDSKERKGYPRWEATETVSPFEVPMKLDRLTPTSQECGPDDFNAPVFLELSPTNPEWCQWVGPFLRFCTEFPPSYPSHT